MSVQIEPDLDLIRIAVALESKAPAELREFVRELNESGQGAGDFADNLEVVESHLRQLANIVEAARHRVIMCAAQF